MRARFLLALGLCLLVVVGAAGGCGTRTGLRSLDDEGLGGGDGGIPAGCGDNKCRDGENCTSCPQDCGLCKTCLDGVCNGTETCASCPDDCGLCQTCGDGACKDNETCLSCPEDCDACEKCGDGVCKAPETCLNCAPDCDACESCGDDKCNPDLNETCFTCPGDCGSCEGCGDGKCLGSETCASCSKDCGVCSVCGNDDCEATEFETCTNCPADCGKCELLTCFSIVTCALQCLQLNQDPPSFSVTCIANCVSKGCPDVQFFVDQALSCAFLNIDEIVSCLDDPNGGSTIQCVEESCGPELGACLAATCPVDE